MFVSDPSATTQPQPSDIQQLVGLLGNLMPLLLRFQSQAFQPQAFEQPFQGGPAMSLSRTRHLIIRRRKISSETLSPGSLRTLSAYLETNAGRHAGLENCVPIVTQAAQRFAARDYTEAFNLIWLAYHTIETIRATDPQIPPLRGSGQAPADQTSSSVH